MMRKTLAAIIFSGFIFSCGNSDQTSGQKSLSGQKVLDETMECLATDWCKTSSSEMFKAARSLDFILEQQHLLGRKTGADYLAFFSSHKKVFIPQSTPGFSSMVKLSGAPENNGGVLAACLTKMNGEQSEFSEESPFYGFCKHVDAFMRSGIPDFEDFGKKVFSRVSKTDMDHDPALVLYYMLWGCQNIRFEKQTESIFSKPVIPGVQSSPSQNQAPPPPPPPVKFVAPRAEESDR